VGEGTNGLLDRLLLTSYTDPAWSALVGRSISAAASTLSVLLVYLLGRQVSTARTACMGALFAAVSVVAVRQAHFALPDSTMAFLATLCFYLSFQVYLKGSWRSYLLAGVCAGLVVATKYNGAFTAFGLVAAHLLRRRGEGRFPPARTLLDPKMIAAVTVAGASVVVASPYLILARDQYLGVARYQVSSLSFTLSQATPWWWVVRGLIESEWMLGVLMVLSLGWAFGRRHPLDLIVLAAWIPSFIYIGSWTRQSLHYLLHFYPILALTAARLVDRMAEDVDSGVGLLRAASSAKAGKPRESLRTALLLLLISACAVPSAWRIAASDHYLALRDTRSMAADWINANVPGGSTLAMTWLPYCPTLDLETTRDGLTSYFRGNSPALAALRRSWSTRPAYRLVNLEVWRQQPLVPEPLSG
jgi:4-amino-4-deoxy-L-arabinose transferase-like glycosyltransferase